MALEFARPKSFYDGMPSGTFLSAVCSIASFAAGAVFVQLGEALGAVFLAAPFLGAIIWNTLVNSLGIGRARYLRLTLAETSALAYTLGYLWERSGTFRLATVLALLAVLGLGGAKLVMGNYDTASVTSQAGSYETAGMRKNRSAPETRGDREPFVPIVTPTASTNSRA